MANNIGKHKRALRDLVMEVAKEFGEQDDLVVDIVETGKHFRIYMSLDGQVNSRFVITSKTASDWRAMKNVERDVRKELTYLVAIGRG